MEQNMETEEQGASLAGRVRSKLCELAFDGGGSAQQVRCLELLAKLLGMYDGPRDTEPVTIVEDM